MLSFKEPRAHQTRCRRLGRKRAERPAPRTPRTHMRRAPRPRTSAPRPAEASAPGRQGAGRLAAPTRREALLKHHSRGNGRGHNGARARPGGQDEDELGASRATWSTARRGAH